MLIAIGLEDIPQLYTRVWEKEHTDNIKYSSIASRSKKKKSSRTKFSTYTHP